MCKESIVLKLPCRWSRYHMLRNGSLSKSFNGSIIERKAADTTIPWHGMSEGLECVVFNSHTSTDYVLEGAELSASSDSWAGNWVCLGRAAWLRSETPLGPGLISVALRLPPSRRIIVACRLLRFTKGMDGPLLPLDERSLMAASLKADGPVWGVSFTSLQLALAGHSSGLPGFAVLPTWWCAKGLKRLSFVLLSNKSWRFTNKKVKIVFWWCLEAYGESVATATFSALCQK